MYKKQLTVILHLLLIQTIYQAFTSWRVIRLHQAVVADHGIYVGMPARWSIEVRFAEKNGWNGSLRRIPEPREVLDAT